ncbi:MAG: hypothetical protein D6770_03625 [Anaerolineae bacterium]|nr:MAG: hypothetical protein D6770_03625 [Anaerolineae bacterium]
MPDSRPAFPPIVFRHFVAATVAEFGRQSLEVVLHNAGLAGDIITPDALARLDAESAAQAYANLQRAIRLYYGRGARGALLRIGGETWRRLLADAPLTVKAQARFVRSLPVDMRPKPILDLLARLLSARQGDVTVHTLDLDLLLVDRISPTTLGQSDDEPICYVTLGMAREALVWATEHAPDIAETACRAMGAQECEFKVTRGG